MRQIMREYWPTRKTITLHDLTFYGTSLQKLQERNQGVPSTNTTSNKNQNRGPTWQTRGSTVNVTTSSNTESTFLGQKSVVEPNVYVINTASTMISPLSSDLFLCPSSTQAYANRCDPCEVCFDKRHRTLDCPLIPNKQRKGPMYLIGVSICGPQPQETVRHGTPPPAYPRAVRDHHNPKFKHVFPPHNEAAGCRQTSVPAPFEIIMKEAP